MASASPNSAGSSPARGETGRALPHSAVAQEQDAPVRDRAAMVLFLGDSLSRSGYINRSFGGPSATGGVDHKLRSHDFLAGSFNWTRPTGDGMRDQYTAEVFYRFYFSERLAFTPDVQWVISPALNPDASSIWLFGIRARIEF